MKPVPIPHTNHIHSQCLSPNFSTVRIFHFLPPEVPSPVIAIFPVVNIHTEITKFVV